MDTIKIDKGNTLMIAHRGLSGIEKENTICSFIAAGNHSFYGLECDIHKTSDGKYIIIHDDDTSRVSLENLSVESSTFSELRSINLLDVNGQTFKEYYFLPLLQEYIEVAKRYEKKCVIEFKNRFLKEDIKEVLEIIKDMDYYDNCIFISFDDYNLKEIRKMDEHIELQFLTSVLNDEIMQMCFENNFNLDAVFKIINKDVVDKFHNHNLKVNVWTVNDPLLARSMIECGVDYITTNILE